MISQNDLPFAADLPDSLYLSPDSSVSLYLDNYYSDVETADSLLRYEFSSPNKAILWELEPEVNELTLTTNLGFDTPAFFYIEAIDDSNEFVIDSIQIRSKIASEIDPS